MTVNIAAFRIAFPEFANTVTYTDAQVQFYLDVWYAAFSGSRWGVGKLQDLGVSLYVAHSLSLEYEAQRAAARGANPGQIIAALSGGTVDKVSYQRSTHSILDPKNGHWNLSVYGLRYLQLQNMVGAGPVQISASGSCGDVYPFAGPGGANPYWP